MGLGKELLEKIKKEAKKLECNLIQWQTPTQNERAITFYKRNNAITKKKERFFLNI
ncbi:GNAT family N-acetyltransferase [Halarcobacter sp.]|uniref:GNAT family N-acetyltransferase n=1 Tax=Halarcobacter sp. TaxID=2321133 RepID=UPI002AA7F19D|nr:GNAT family N-acetyltransferase [Halarcobacter sp.]